MVDRTKTPAPAEAPDLSALDDRDLVELCQKQLPLELAAYREILLRYEGIVYNTSLKMIGNRQEAEEATQDTFLQVYHKLHQFEGRSTFKTWLFRVAYNFCLGRRGKLARRRERENEFAEEQINKTDNYSTKLVEGELSETVQEAINRLKGEQKRIIILKFVTGLTLAEIADVLGIKLSATKMRLYRSLEALKEAYLAVSGDGEPQPEDP